MAENERAHGEQENEQELKVTDRRHFTSDGQVRPDAAAGEAEGPDPDARAGAVDEQERRGFERRPVEEPEGVDFTMLINAMAEPALLFLGEIPHPGTGKPHVDLERARIQIDMLDLLRVKCRGNLAQDEDTLLDHILYKLRMAYVQRANQPEG